MSNVLPFRDVIPFMAFGFNGRTVATMTGTRLEVDRNPHTIQRAIEQFEDVLDTLRDLHRQVSTKPDIIPWEGDECTCPDCTSEVVRTVSFGTPYNDNT